ncbi:hypothetical protein Tco_1336030 [Tanacetum coccineum]
MIEPEPMKKLSKKDQLKLDEEVVQRLQAEFDEQERIEREKAEVNIALKEIWDDIQANIEADLLLSERFSKKDDAEIAQESSSKRVGDELEQESIKKQNMDEDKETTELKSLMEVIPDEEEVAVDAIPLAIKPPSIVDWKIYKKGKKSYCQIIRADGTKYVINQDPVEDLDLVLYGDLKTIFDPHVEDQVWKNQSDYRVLEWKLYDSCGVHSLRKQKVHIHMLVEKRYHLTSPTITDMLNKKLKADHWNEMCYQLLKLITK